MIQSITPMNKTENVLEVSGCSLSLCFCLLEIKLVNKLIPMNYLIYSQQLSEVDIIISTLLYIGKQRFRQ